MSMKILLADDSITIQKVIGIIFGGEEYSLTVVDNGQAAIDKARETVPDVLLIDALMPGMTGYEVCELIRSTPHLAAKPILLLTGSFEPFDEDKAKSCGADDFLAKPFESQQIVSKVKELYQLGSSRAATTPQIQPPPEMQPFETAVEFTTPPPVDPFTTAATNDPAGTAEPDDIWGAFISTAEPAPEPAPAAEQATAAPMEEIDVFALINEEPGAGAVQPAPLSPSPESAVPQWIPVEEQTFEFHEEVVTEPMADILTESAPARTGVSFGEIAFEEPAGPVPTASPVSSSPAAVPMQLSEEQIKAAIASLSRDTIERIVWEVVPDLAETLIKDAIRKIKEGI